jgi:nucleotide-binding universal stress UspA family protein
MYYKTIMVHVDESIHTPKRVQLAAAIARQGQAHLIGAAATALPGSYYLPELIGESTVSLTAYLEYLEQRAENALAVFESAVTRSGVASFEKRVIKDEAGAGISMLARYADLLVVGQTDSSESLPATQPAFPEYVAMNAGRPVLVVPHAGEQGPVGRRIVLGWDASIEATRALSAAMPFLLDAEQVQVAVFNPKAHGRLRGEQPGGDIGAYLSRHGIKADIVQRDLPRDIDTGKALLSQASDFGADMLVMGCFGHSRFREALLGGASNTVLHSMSVPVLMSH